VEKIKILELIKEKDLMWFNTFVGDFLLILVIGVLQILTKFNSKTVFFITGMMVVYITWQLNDLLNSRKTIKLEPN